MQWIYEALQKYDKEAESKILLEEGHKITLQSVCYKDYGMPSFTQ